tara:strand:+ start:551 stop:1363 length:813 start_codon:yes stop_codon:yes gene_type:complete
MKMPEHLDYPNLDEIKRQKIFKYGQFPKLDRVFDELMDRRDIILADFLEFAQGGTIQEKIQWNKENNAISVMNERYRAQMLFKGTKTGNEPIDGAIVSNDGNVDVDSWQATFLKYDFSNDLKGNMKGSTLLPDHKINWQHNAIKYPNLNNILDAYGKAVPVCFYSTLMANTVIERHTGIENRDGYHLRLHIPLHIPEGDIFLEVNGEEVDWSEPFAFNNQFVHSAWNNSNEHRLILLIDFYRDYLGIPPGLHYKDMQDITGNPEERYSRA